MNECKIDYKNWGEMMELNTPLYRNNYKKRLNSLINI